MALLIVSFGFKYGDTPNGLVIDVRKLFQRNPYRIKELRSLRGTDPEVAADIMSTPGFGNSYDHLRRIVCDAFADNPLHNVVHLGCTGGHHRSVFLAESIAHDLGAGVMHRDIFRK